MRVLNVNKWPLVLVVLLVGVLSCNQLQTNSKDGRVTETGTVQSAGTVIFDTTAHHYGTLVQGEKVGYTFRFTNTGAGHVVIENVQAGCGCTAVSWSKDPVAPGEQGNVEIIFDSSGRNGNQYKTIKVITNGTKKEHVLIVTAEIILNN